MGSSLRVKLMTHREKRGDVYAIAFQLTINGVAKYEYTNYSVKENQFKEGLSDWVRKHPDAALINRNIELRRADIMNNLLDAQAGKFPLQHKSIFTGTNAMVLMINHILDAKANYYAARESTWYDRMQTAKRELKECWGKYLPLAAIGLKQAQAYEIYLRGIGNGPNMIAKKFQTLRSIIDECKDAGQYSGINAFALVKITRQPVLKEKLTWPAISSIVRPPSVLNFLMICLKSSILLDFN